MESVLENLVLWNKEYAHKADAFAATKQWVEDANKIVASLLPGVIVDLGCNTGRFLSLASQKIEAKFYGVDINEEGIRIAIKRKVPAVFYKSIIDVPCEIDTVVCMHSLLQMQDPIKMFSNVWEKMKSGGKLIVLSHNRLNNYVWKIPNLFNGYETDLTIHQEHSKGELGMFFRNAGFICEKLERHNANGLVKLAPLFSQHLWYEGRKP